MWVNVNYVDKNFYFFDHLPKGQLFSKDFLVFSVLPKNERKISAAFLQNINNGILLPELLWPTVRKNCSSDQEKLLKFEAEVREFAKFLRCLEKFIHIVKGQNNVW